MGAFTRKLERLITKSLQERFFDGYQVSHDLAGDRYIEVFVNPTSEEIESVSKNDDVRWVADNDTRQFFVFNPVTLHDSVLKKIGYSYSDDVLTGVSDTRSGRCYGISFGSFSRESEHVKNLLSQNWGWVNKYTDVKDELEQERWTSGVTSE